MSLMKSIKDWPGKRAVYARWETGEEQPYAEFFENLDDVPTGGYVAVYRLAAVKRAVRVAPVPARTVLKPLAKRKAKR